MILFIDDEERWVKTYIEAIEMSGYQCNLITNVDGLTPLINGSNSLDGVTLIILDIMMPARNRYESVDTDEGMRTGELVLSDLNQIGPMIPIIILTNKDKSDDFDNHGYNYATYLQKQSTKPSELVDVIRETLSN